MTVLVAGGTGALGAAVVRELAGSGYEVTVLDRHGEADGATTVHADLLDPAATAEAVAGVDGLEAVVNLVGGFAMGPKVGESSLEDFEQMLRLNLVPAFNLARAPTHTKAPPPPSAIRGIAARARLNAGTRLRRSICSKSSNEDSPTLGPIAKPPTRFTTASRPSTPATASAVAEGSSRSAWTVSTPSTSPWRSRAVTW